MRHRLETTIRPTLIFSIALVIIIIMTTTTNQIMTVYSSPVGDEAGETPANGSPTNGGGSSDGPSDEIDPTDEEPPDGTGPIGGSSEPLSDEESLNGGGPPSTEAYVCNGDTNTCSCKSWRDCQKMSKDGVCLSGGHPLWGLNLDEKTVPDDAKSGSCPWKK